MSPFVRERTLRDLVDDLEAVVHFLSVAQKVLYVSVQSDDACILTGELKSSLRVERFDVAAEAVNRAIDTLEEIRLRTP